MSSNLIVEKVGTVPFTQIANSILHNPNLTMQAKGLFALLVSFPPGWNLNMADLIARSKDGRHATYRALDDLINEGYVERFQTASDDGRFGTTLIKVCQNPHTENPYTGNQTKSVDNPHSDFPHADYQQQSNNEYSNIDEQILKEPPTSPNPNLGKTSGQDSLSLESPPIPKESELDICIRTLPALWNEHASKGKPYPMKQIIGSANKPPSLSPERVAQLRKIWKSSEIFRERWREIPEAFASAKWCCGSPSREKPEGWIAGIDNMLKTYKGSAPLAERVLEGFVSKPKATGWR